MKKLSLIIIFLVMSFCLFAQGNSSGNASSKKAKNKKPLLGQERMFEVGFINLNVNFANSFLSAADIPNEVIIIDLDKLADGFKLNLGVNFTPFYFTLKTKEGWGIGLSTDIDAIGILNISGNMLTLNEAVKDNSDVSGAVFSSATLKTFFNLEKVKVKFNPSLFYTLAYVTPPKNKSSSVVYTLDYSDGTVACIDYAMLVYLGYSLENNRFSLTSFPGLDFSVGFEYPFAKEIGLTKILPFLDFDLSLDLINCPFIPSTVSDYMPIKGRIGKDEPIKIINKDDDDDSSLFTSDEIVRSGKVFQINRPFKMLVKADWRPFLGKNFLTLTPVIGFCYSELYYERFALETGLNACFNFANFFLLKTGFNYTDRMFVHSLGIVFNSKAVEFDIGVDFRSQEISQVWRGAGLGLNFGLKVGW